MKRYVDVVGLCVFWELFLNKCIEFFKMIRYELKTFYKVISSGILEEKSAVALKHLEVKSATGR